MCEKSDKFLHKSDIIGGMTLDWEEILCYNTVSLI